MVGLGSVSFVEVCLHLTQTNPLSSRVLNRNSVARNCAQLFLHCVELYGIALQLQGPTIGRKTNPLVSEILLSSNIID